MARQLTWPAAALIALGLALLSSGCGEGGENTSTADRVEAPPAAVAGSKAATPGVPTSPRGDNSIQLWGREAAEGPGDLLAARLQSYLDARAARDWAAACSYLTPRLQREQGRYAGGAPCPQAMATFARRARGSELRKEAEIDVRSVRIGGGYAFVIYRRPDGFFASAFKRNAGRWWLLSVTPQPLA